MLSVRVCKIITNTYTRDLHMELGYGMEKNFVIDGEILDRFDFTGVYK